jgi:sterol desaturase/sphingolipid hydroxylase (fatty acid hydroxylase superfamily)
MSWLQSLRAHSERQPVKMIAAALWNTILQRYSHEQIDFFGSLLVQFTFFWIPSAFYISLPSIFPNFAARSKLQIQEKQPTVAELWECLVLVSRNQLFSSAMHGGLILPNTEMGRQSIFRFETELPGFLEIAKDIVISILVREVLFYYIHYALHRPSLYAKIHKRHHRFTAPVALAAQ